MNIVCGFCGTINRRICFWITKGICAYCKQLKKYCSKVYSCSPGEILRIQDILQFEAIKQLTFLGKVHKGLILKRPKFDSKALDLLKNAKNLKKCIDISIKIL